MPATSASEQRGAAALPPSTAACIGAFDGLHLGHQALLSRAAKLADRVALVSFDPHPMRVLAPQRAPALLQTPAQRLRVAGEAGAAQVVLLPFDRRVSELTPEAFVREFLADGLRPTAIVVGHDFRFGHGRAGTPSTLAELLPGVTVEVVEAVGVPEAAHPDGQAPGGKLGSTAIRRAVAEGDVAAARAMLGRHYAVAGTVVTGDGRGRTIGFRTANVAVDNEVMPPAGVYATALRVYSGEHAGACWPSVSNLGTSPTFTGDGAPLRLEAHVLDSDLGESLYDQDVEVSFVARLRDELRFDGIDALVAQIARDAEDARARLDAAAMNAVTLSGGR